MPDPNATDANVAEMVALVERLIGTATPPTASTEDLTMRTETRDTLLAHLQALINDTTRIMSELRDTDPRRITSAILESHMQTVVLRVDNAFLVAHPNLAATARGDSE